MKMVSWLFAGVIAMSLSCAATAGVISGSAVTAGGKTVNLQGMEWLSLDKTRGYSRSQIEAGQDGLFDAGWRYANRQETSLLLQSLWGGVQGGSWANGDGADWFFQHLGGGDLWAQHNQLHSFFYGTSGECTAIAIESCLGKYGVSYSNVGHPPTGWFLDEFGLSASAAPMTVPIGENSSSFGSLLVRDSKVVSEPGTLLLALGACLGLAGRRRLTRSRDGASGGLPA